MLRNLFKFFMLRRILGGAGGDRRTGRGGGIGCLGFIAVLVIVYLIYQYFFAV
jgi:hypothetical protein